MAVDVMIRSALGARWGLAIFLFLVAMAFAIPAAAAPYAAMVIDARTGKVLHSRNADTRLHPASLTKMMTLYVAFQAIENGEISLDDKITISAHAASEPPSKLGLRKGQKIAFRYLIRAAAVKSANDAATAIGEAISGSEAEFSKRMTRTAKQLGMRKTTFKNAHGLTARGHLSTARDMTTLGRHLFYDYPEYYNLFSRRSTDAGMRSVNNTNRRLLGAYRGADGIKTGYTRAAGFNLVASAERGNERIIATVFGSTSSAARTAQVSELMDLGFKRAPSRVTISKPKPPTYVAKGSANTGAIIRTSGLVKSSKRPHIRPGSEVIVASVDNTSSDAVPSESIRPTPRPSEAAGLKSELLAAVEESVSTAFSSTVEDKEAVPNLKPAKLIAQASKRNDVIVSPPRPANAERRTWAVSVGLFNTQYAAEKYLLKTALSESSTLKDSRRVVVRTNRGFDANFQGLTWDRAVSACARLKARSLNCSFVSG